MVSLRSSQLPRSEGMSFVSDGVSFCQFQPDGFSVGWRLPPPVADMLLLVHQILCIFG